MAETNQEYGDIVSCVEDAGRDHRVSREFPLVQHCENPYYHAEDDEAYHRRRAPRVFCSAIFKAEEECECAADCQQCSGPVDIA